jgi:hypothetical protein
MPVCTICEYAVDKDDWKFIVVHHHAEKGEYKEVVVCNWCAHLVKEAFSE